MTATLDAALGYAARGWRVLPLDGKAPLGRLVRNGVKNATNDAAVIRGWWKTAPGANVGIATGEGLAVLDVDPRNRGDTTLDAYIFNNGGIGTAETPEVLTGGGGRHLYYTAPPGFRCAVLGPGLDLKGEGGYVVAPPSVHPDTGKEYTWHPARSAGTPFSALPQWASNRGERVHQARPDAHWAKVAREGFAEGERNTGTASYVGHLLFWLDPEEAYELALIWNRTRNRPPLPDEELHKTFMSIAQREAAKARGARSRW